MPNISDHYLLVCATCKGADAAEQVTAELAHRLPDRFAIRAVNCMAGCERPTTIGFQAPGKAQYLFGDIATEQDLDAVAQFADQYFRSEDGWTNATDRPCALLTKTLSRMPRIERA